MNDMNSIEDRWKTSPDVLSGKFDDEVILLSRETNGYYHRGMPGSRIWELLESPRSVDELCAALQEEFEVDADTCRTEAREFIQDMVEKKLIKKFSGEDKKDIPYWISDAVTVHFDSNRNVYFRTPKEEIEADNFGLPILSAFLAPSSLEQAVRNLSTRVSGVEEWKDMTGTIMNMIEAGVLVSGEAQEGKSVRHELMPDFDYPTIHIRMLNDTERTGKYLAAIREMVRPGDIVVDLGTGTGVLAIAAAQAGAAHVYAVESGAMMARIARENVAHNGLQDKVTVLQGWSTHIDLPQKADLLISEIIGNEPLGEHLIRYTTDAVGRWLKPGARLLPATLNVLAIPVEALPRLREKHCFSEPQAERWRQWYSIDFKGCAKAPYPPLLRYYIGVDELDALRPLATPMQLATFDLKQLHDWQLAPQTMVIQREGTLDGFLVFFELQISPHVNFSANPQTINRETFSWKYPLYMFSTSRRVSEGQAIPITYEPTEEGSFLRVD